MKKFDFTIRGNKYEVKVKSLEDNLAKVEVNGSQYEVQLLQEVKTTKTPKLIRSQPLPTREKSMAPAPGINKVTAPLPGILIKILVKEGDTVKLGDNLFVLEAMKMENNILAEKAGTVRALKAKAGDSVMQGDLILEIE